MPDSDYKGGGGGGILQSTFCYDCSEICGRFNHTFKFDEQMTCVAS